MDNSPSEAKLVWREDLVAAVLSSLVVAGLFVDGWSHLNRYEGKLGSFFTPWHGLLYAAFSANAAWVVSRNRHLWHPEITAPDVFFEVGRYRLRYPFAIFGLLVATVGMLGDVAWHTAFGEEEGVARVIAPFHVLLVVGASLLLMAPLRSVWNAPDVYGPDSRLVRVAPGVISLTLAACLAGFVLQWVSPYVEWPGARQLSEAQIAAAVLLATLCFGVPLLLALRQWPAAIGAALSIPTGAAVALSWLGLHRFAWTIAAAAAGGVAVEVVMIAFRRLESRAHLYAAAVVFPAVTWPIHFSVLGRHYGESWPVDLVLGIAALSGLLLATVEFILALGEDAPTAHRHSAAT